MGKSLWGNLEALTEDIRTPKEILEEQANYLQSSFGDLIKGRIVVFKLGNNWADFYRSLDIEYDFCFSFKVFSDYIEKYEYEICRLAYGIKIYPLAISFSNGVGEELSEKFDVFDGDTIIVESEERLCSVLGEILTSKEVHQVLRGLLSMARKEKVDQGLPF